MFNLSMTSYKRYILLCKFMLKIFYQRNARIARSRRQNKRLFLFFQRFFGFFIQRRKNIYGKIFFRTGLAVKQFQNVPAAVVSAT